MAWESPGTARIQVSGSGRLVVLLLSSACLGSGCFLATSHPILPWLVSGVFLGFLPVFFWCPWFGLLALPALLPLLNFSPWTGWLIVEEFDLLVLAVLSAGYFRMWRDGSCLKHGKTFAALLALCVFLTGPGLADPAIAQVNWFSGYMTPLNSVRVGKSLLWLALLFPLITEVVKPLPSNQAITGFFRATLLGSGWVVLAVLWERAFYPGLEDISTPYRTVGPFWEMHHGGAALDAYLVLVAPLLVWAWRTTVSLTGRIFLGAFAVAFGYACLTTFSRGVIFAMGGALILQCVLLGWRARKSILNSRKFRLSSAVVLGALVLEVLLVFGTDSFMNYRLQSSGRDFGGRLQHWERGLRQLESPMDWVFGIGLGKLPSRWSSGDDGLVLPGRFEMAEVADGTSGLRLFGPDSRETMEDFGRFFALSQRFAANSSAPYPFSMTARSERSARVLVQLCASHLLYPARCDEVVFAVEPSGWQPLKAELPGAIFDGAAWQKTGHGVFMLSVLTPGTMVEIREVHLGIGGESLLRNPQFKAHEGQWFAQSFSYFLPWHIDNLYLELLVETGIVGLLVFFAVIVRTMWGFFQGYLHGETFSTELLSSLSGLLALGLVVSVIDMPRVAMLAGLFIVWGRQFFRENNG